MFNHYKLQLLPGDDYQEYLTGESQTITQVSGVNAATKYYVLNGTLLNDDAINEFTTGDAFLTDNLLKAKCFTGATTIYSYIDGDVVRNGFYKDGVIIDP